MKTRIITSIIGIPLVILVIWLSGWVLGLIGAAAAVIIAYEYRQMLAHRGDLLPIWLLCGVSLVIYSLIVIFTPPGWFFILPLLVIIWGLTVKNKYAYAAAGVFYIACGIGCLIALRTSSDLYYPIIFALLVTWMSDSGAYFVGRKFGRTKLAATISPNKTVEGAIGGIIVAVLSGVIYSFFIPQLNTLVVIPVALLLAVLGQPGDLIESAIKRWAGVKDAGTILPGHGGLFDRMDSLMLVAVICYIFVGVASF